MCDVWPPARLGARDVSALPREDGATGADRVFWMTVRQALLTFIAAIEARYLPDVRRRR